MKTCSMKLLHKLLEQGGEKVLVGFYHMTKLGAMRRSAAGLQTSMKYQAIIISVSVPCTPLELRYTRIHF